MNADLGKGKVDFHLAGSVNDGTDSNLFPLFVRVHLLLSALIRVPSFFCIC
jgi:hypothetical protein